MSSPPSSPVTPVVLVPNYFVPYWVHLVWAWGFFILCFMLRPCASGARSLMLRQMERCQQGLFASCQKDAQRRPYSDKFTPGTPRSILSPAAGGEKMASQLWPWTTQFFRGPKYIPDVTFPRHLALWELLLFWWVSGSVTLAEEGEVPGTWLNIGGTEQLYWGLNRNLRERDPPIREEKTGEKIRKMKRGQNKIAGASAREVCVQWEVPSGRNKGHFLKQVR